MKKPELLAPVGNKETFFAAIEAGCDAVYLGGTHFGARALANNFTEEELKEIIPIAHIYGVKVYVTVNTIIYESMVKSFLEYIDFLHKNNVDAVIMQDLGMIDLVRKTYPNLEIHASTQMHIHNLEGVQIAEKLGIKRVVLARETDIDTIEKIKKKTNLELEIFVHGALCICYSGQCLLSSLMNGRSGNSGTCSQPCRMKYDFYDDDKKLNKEKYLLSTKDLNSLQYIGKLIDIGVDSLKIEGRMKSKEYVYQVVSLYRKAIDSYCETGKVQIDETEIKKLKTIFNRKYTKGFLFKEKNENFIHSYRPNHIGIPIGKVVSVKKNLATILLNDELNRLDGIRILSHEDTGFIIQTMTVNKKKVEKATKGDLVTISIPNIVYVNDLVVKTLDKNIVSEIDTKIKQNKRKVYLTGNLICELNKPIVLTVTDGINEITLFSEEKIEKKKTKEITEDKIKEKLNKLGGTVYQFKQIKIKKDDDIFIRFNILNELRRKMVLKLNEVRDYKLPYKKDIYKITLPNFNEKKGYSVLIKNKEIYELIKNKMVLDIYAEEPIFKEINDSRLILRLPRVVAKEKKHEQTVLGEEIGSLINDSVITDFTIPVVNSYTVAYLHSIGVKRVTLSYELNDHQIEKIIQGYQNRYNKNPNLELIVSSFPEVMISKFDLIKYFNAKGITYLSDIHNNHYSVTSNGDYMTIYFSNKIENTDYQKYFDMGINRLRIHIEDKNDINKLK